MTPSARAQRPPVNRRLRLSVAAAYNYGRTLLYIALAGLVLPRAALAQGAGDSPEAAVNPASPAVIAAEAIADNAGTAAAEPAADGTSAADGTAVAETAAPDSAAAAAAQETDEKPAIAVYVTGDSIPKTTKDAMSAFLLDALVNSGNYRTIERSETFLAEIDREQAKQRDGSVDDAQISQIGKQAGVRFVCVANITPTLGSYQVSARVIDVETAAVSASGVSGSPLESLADLKQASAAVVYKMLGVRMKTEENFELLTDNEKTALEQSIQQTVQQTMRTKQPYRKTFWFALSADVAGAGILGLGLYEEMNVRSLIADGKYSKSKSAETARDICYVIGTIILVSGISIHIFF